MSSAATRQVGAKILRGDVGWFRQHAEIMTISIRDWKNGGTLRKATRAKLVSEIECDVCCFLAA